MAKQETETTEVKLREKYIKYMGLSDIRVIRKETWEKIGVEADTVQWDKTNGWKVKAGDLPEGVLRYCEHDSEFALVEE